MNKKKVFDVIFPHKYLGELMEYLERGRFLLARSVLFDMLQDAEPPIDYVRDDGEMIIHNAKVKRYKDIEEIYNELMHEIEAQDEKKKLEDEIGTSR